MSRYLPRVSRLLVHWFGWYAERYIARHFHQVRISRSGIPPDQVSGPVVVYLNHASWWDPLICALVIRRFFPARKAYAPIDARMLSRYRFFKHLGFFPVDPGAARGAAQFLRVSQAALADNEAMLWVTPQGRFADVRERPVAFKRGLSELARRVPHVKFIPLAIEYSFWEEKQAEVLLRFGPSQRVTQNVTLVDLHTAFERSMNETQDALAAQVLRRDPLDFVSLAQGTEGVGLAYDSWRQVSAFLRGEKPQLSHGTK